MEWALTWGDREEGLLAVEAQTGKTPDALLTRPKLHPWVEWYYEAFWLVDAGRPVYQGSIGRIPLTEISAYFQVFDVGETESRKLFIKTIRALDSVYVRIVNERIKRDIAKERKRTEEDRVNGR